MHMADALLSPTVGGAMWAASGAVMVYGASKVKEEMDDRKIPLMGVLGAFIFAAQMINFTIPGTGSSGHLGGGMILAILLGSPAAFLTMAAILTVQALFFADGGLLALGCNIFNLGFFPAFVVYPLIFKPLIGRRAGSVRLATACIISAVVGLQLGAFGVVIETVLSGVTELSFISFSAVMLPVHLGIGLVEGLATAAVVGFVWKARPEILDRREMPGRFPIKGLVIGLAAATIVIGGFVSWFASAHPDGLEWSVARITGREELEAPERGVFPFLARLQEKTSILPDYGFKGAGETESGQPEESEEAWPAVSGETTVSGLVGAAVTLLAVVAIGIGLKKLLPKQKIPRPARKKNIFGGVH